MIEHARDTFLHFLADNLTGIEVHPVRQDPNDPSAATLKLNAINVEFLDFQPNQVSTYRVSVDMLNDSEFTAVSWMQRLWDLLKAAYMTPVFDYTNPSAPAATKFNLIWDRNKVRFSKVAADTYVHYTCTLALQFAVK